MHASKPYRFARFLAVFAMILGLLSTTGAGIAGSVGSVIWGIPTLTLTGSAVGTRVDLSWTTAYYAQSYAEVFRDGVRVQRVTGFRTSFGMPDYNVHRYTVRSYQAGGFQGIYHERSVNIGPAATTLPTPRPVYPLTGDLTPRSVNLRIDPIGGVTRYRFEVWNAVNGALVSRTDTASTTVRLSLPAKGRFRWRVAALSMNGGNVAAVGRFSEQISFSTR